MKFKQGQLVKILGCSTATETKWLEPINKACEKFSINTRLRLAAFIAQVGHESGNLSAVVENLNYSADGLQKTWPTRFNSSNASAYARNPEKIANRVYGGRMGNGPEASGEGWKYRGRGLIQCTGKTNYDAFSQACGVNAVANPESLAQPDNAALSAAWFWGSKGLNAYADRQEFLTITKRINGGTIGQAHREALYKKALIVLSDETLPEKEEDVAKKADEVSPDTTAPITEQKTPAAKNGSISEPRAANGSGGTSKYPWNLVTESRSGHIIEVDDTPGAERLAMGHRTGSYWEMDSVGTLTHKSVLDQYKLTKGDSYDYTGGSYTQQVKGQSYRQTSGDTIFKADGSFFVTSSKMQFNTGMLSVSGEVNSPNVNSPLFSGFGGMAFGDMLAKEALVAYSLKKGKAPMIGGSLAFMSAPGAPGSAEGRLTNDLSTKSPNGTPWVTNGVRQTIANSATYDSGSGNNDSESEGGSSTSQVSSSSAGVSGSSKSTGSTYNSDSEASAVSQASKTRDLLSTAIGAAVAVTAVSEILRSGNNSDDRANIAMAAAANEIDTKEALEEQQTPVFVKHVSFDKPTLLSMSRFNAGPDPALYVNNYHTLVGANGVGTLCISDGKDWVPVGDPTKANDYTDAVVGGVSQELGDLIAEEVINRGIALAEEQLKRAEEIAAEARARQKDIVDGLLAEALARGASVTAEAEARQTQYESVASHITTLTAALGDNAAALEVERRTRADAVSAEAYLREVLAAKVGENTATIFEEKNSRANETSALNTMIVELTSTTNDQFATVSNQMETLTTLDSAMANSLEAVITQTGDNTAAILSESTARTNAISSLSERVDSVLAKTNNNLAAIVTESSARSDADSALADRIDALVAKTDNATAAIAEESVVRADAISAQAQQLLALHATVDDIEVTVSESFNATVSTVNSIKATWGVKTNINGHIAGVGLVSELIKESGQVTSDFIVQADTFKLVNPSDSTKIVIPFSVDSDGNANFAGKLAAASGYFQGSVYGGAFGNSYDWPANGAGSGFYIGAEGLLLGNKNTWDSSATGGYFKVTADGDVYAPEFSIVDGVANFAGQVTGTNVVGTSQLESETVFAPRSASASNTIISINSYPNGDVLLTVPPLTLTDNAASATVVILFTCAHNAGKYADNSEIGGFTYEQPTFKIYRKWSGGESLVWSGLLAPADSLTGIGCFSVTDVPGVGSWTYELRSAASGTAEFYQRTLIIMAGKR